MAKTDRCYRSGPATAVAVTPSTVIRTVATPSVTPQDCCARRAGSHGVGSPASARVATADAASSAARIASVTRRITAAPPSPPNPNNTTAPNNTSDVTLPEPRSIAVRTASPSPAPSVGAVAETGRQHKPPAVRCEPTSLQRARSYLTPPGSMPLIRPELLPEPSRLRRMLPKWHPLTIEVRRSQVRRRGSERGLQWRFLS